MILLVLKKLKKNLKRKEEIKIPNWCNGNVEVKGTPENVENFCKLFIFEDEVGEKQDKYFARSFIHLNWKDFKKEYLGENEVGFDVDFAWSCWSCLFEGYPNRNECVTLEWAIKEYNVEVEINTEEDGEGFEEKITTKNKKPIYENKTMPEYTCQKCGNIQVISNKNDLEDVECWECGAYGKWKNELAELIKEKMEKKNVKC